MRALSKRSKLGVIWPAVLLTLMAAVSRGRAQFRDWSEGMQESGRPMPGIRYIETDVEADQENFQSSSGHIQSSRLYVSPRLGIGWNSYVYHPNLMTFSLMLEPGYVWQQRSILNQSSQSQQFIVGGVSTANLLALKPYATTLSYSSSHEQVKYDFFDTATVDSQSWGVFTGYREGPIPVNVSFQQRHEDSTDFNQTTLTDQSTLNLNARNERKEHGLTDLSYQFNEFDRETHIGGRNLPNENMLNHAALTDTEHFNRGQLQSALRYDNRSTEGNSSSDLNASVNYSVEHTSNFSSYYNYSLSKFTDQDSDVLQNYAVAGVTHHLYDSLTSGLDAHGSLLNSRAGDSTIDSLSGGTTANATYTKRLANWGRLTINDTASYTATDQQTSGSELLIPNESHTIPINRLVRLTQPRPIAIVSITDANNVPLQAGLDYLVIQTTDPWQIEILDGPSHISAGATILITYTVRSNPSGTYSTVANQAQIRVGFHGDLVALFAQYGLTDNQASSPAFLLQNDEQFRAGVEFNRSGLHLSAEYDQEHSTFFNSTGYSLAESYSRNLSPGSTIGVDFNQQWIKSEFNLGGSTETQHLTYFDFMLHYQYRITANLNWSVEAGYRRQRGSQQDQDLIAARSYLNWGLGLLQVHLGYEHEDQSINSENRRRDFGFVRLRRSF